MSKRKQESVVRPLEPENLRIALKLYERNPIAALLLAHQLMAIKQCLERGKKGIPNAVAGLKTAIDSLYTHTDFHNVSNKLFLRKLNGSMKPNDENYDKRIGMVLVVC